MQKLTLLIPANKESESLPIFLNELKEYDFKIITSKKDQETIDSILKFKEIEICVQKSKDMKCTKEGINKINTDYF